MLQNEQMRKFIYHKNGWIDDKVSDEILQRAKRNKNINGEKIMRLFLDGKCIYKGPVTLCQTKKKKYCATYGITKERAKERFHITY
jgi:hypothetical protein